MEEKKLNTENCKSPVDKALRIFEKGYNHQIILYGPPGTSKTYSSTLIAAKLLSDEPDKITTLEEAQNYLKDKANFQLIQFHPSYNYEDFVRGIKMDVSGTSPVYSVEDKIFGEFARNAYRSYKEQKNEKYVLIIDEINRAPVATVLGELIYGLEYRGKAVTIPYKLKEDVDNNGLDKNKIVIPPNLYIIGTMNTADRSIGSIDYAVRRRFAFLPLMSQKDYALDTWADTDKKQIVNNLWDGVNKIFRDCENVEDIRLGHTYFMYDPKYADDPMEYLRYRVEYQIIPILKEYLNDGLLNADVKVIEIDNLIKLVEKYSF